MKASDLLVKALENEGVEYIFAVPGEENLDVVESLKDSSIELVVTRHEQGAGFMAATYGRLTGRAGVCMATLGPGATNLSTPAAYAYLGAFPLIMITGQKPIKASKQGQFQIIDIVKLYEPICKLSKQIVNGNTIPSLVREAFRRAEEERPGTVLLELPEDIAAEDTDANVIQASVRQYAVADEFVLNEAVKKIKAAKMPLILLGAAANRKTSWKALEHFARNTGIYFFNTQMGKGVADERCDFFIGTAALSDNDYLHCAVAKADLILNIGHDVVEKPPFLMSDNDKMVIHLNYKSAQVDEVYFPQLELVGDISLTIEKLSLKLAGWKCGPMDYFKLVKQEVERHIVEGSEDDSFPIIPQRFVADTRKAMGENGIIALDNGIYKIWFARNYKAYYPNTVLLDNALATMGAGLSSAMMTAKLNPDKRVLAICGDGGFMMNSQEIETALRMDLNLVVMILNDNAYGMIRWKQQLAGFTDWGLEFTNPDFVKYAEAYGAKGHLVTSAASLVSTLDNAFVQGGLHIVEVPVDYSANVSVLIEELATKVRLLRNK
ncbi:acetolactate synthase large subunit [Shewanella surugensis]|uniref:Acetolactate synthase large subunit n=1 Tax=Shewanella surugensis TaxID=212020 RepID=A0ABT0LDI8_9GAMM|nr:acetolactate synthase large subunit [Shewanella surugensis]MCL1125786.1 acetolactate synthase large subunit [Shewanella surugensis]